MRKLFIVLAIILVLALTLYNWLAYRDRQSYKYALPDNTGLVIRMDMDQLIRKAVWHKLTNPSTLFIDRDLPSIDKDTGKRGIPVPANLFFFTLLNEPENIYLRVPLSDFDHAQEYLSRVFEIENFRKEASSLIGHSKKINLKLALNDRQVVLGYYTHQEIEDSKLADITASLNEDLPQLAEMTGIVSSSADIMAVYNGMEIQTEIERDVIRVTVMNRNSEFNLTGLPWVGPLVESRLNETLANAVRESSRFHVSVKGSVQQTDSITTYEFNDDFEKIEKKELSTTIVPGVEVHLDLDTLHPSESFRISEIKDQFARIGLIYSNHSEQFMCFRNADLGLMTSEHEFKLHVDFSSLGSEVIPWSDSTWVREIRSLKVESFTASSGGKNYTLEVMLNKDLFALLFEEDHDAK